MLPTIPHNYEVEVKSLLGSKEKAEELKDIIKEVDPDCRLISTSKQLDHYFEGGDLESLVEDLAFYISDKAYIEIKSLVNREIAVCSKDKDGEVFIIIKSSVEDYYDDRGLSIEKKVPLTLVELDKLITKNGFKCQSKRAVEKEDFIANKIIVSVKKTDGYGYTAEFKAGVESFEEVGIAKHAIHVFMEHLGISELSQDRLERMLAYYNAYWEDYYGTDKVFIIE